MHTNRLARETSPYLLQHQHNPVDWHPWGPEAFELSRATGKPIFLSVGYSTCYWCHVMERECFENESIAKVMNESCINIKVDREERPDVDQLYMTAVQITTGQGGWPMSVFLTPQLKPFYAGTYFPPRDAHGRPGFPSLVRAIADAWANRREEVERHAAQITSMLTRLADEGAASDPASPVDAPDLDALIANAADDYEPHQGGFGSAPKFPRQTLLSALLTRIDLEPDHPDQPTLASRLKHTLTAMADGGIRDHLGGGFHRYSTDNRWLVPHFEIMLYDQALLAPIYARAARVLHEPRFASVARGICDFVLREMTDETGAFHTAFDAEVDAREGANYLWTRAEIEELLEPEIASRFCTLYGLDEGPNFADPHQGDGTPTHNILHLPHGAEHESDPQIVHARQALLARRATRQQPLLDTKILTSWNALMIIGLCEVSDELDEPRYRDAASRAADFLLRHHVESSGAVKRSSRGGQVKHPGTLEDYASLALALASLARSTCDIRWQSESQRLMPQIKRRFARHDGAYFYSDAQADDLIVRQVVSGDSPLPSATALVARLLMEMGQTDDARQLLQRFIPQLARHPGGMSALLEVALRLPTSASPLPSDTGVDASSEAQSDPLVKHHVHHDTSRRCVLTLEIAPGYHIYDTDTDPKLGLTALRIESPDDQIESIDYPPGELLRLPYGPPVRGHTGSVRMIVRLRESAPRAGRRIVLRYQACNDNACLRPQRLLLDL